MKKLNVHDYEFFSILQITYMGEGDGSIISAIAVPPCSEPVPLRIFCLATGLVVLYVYRPIKRILRLGKNTRFLTYFIMGIKVRNNYGTRRRIAYAVVRSVSVRLAMGVCYVHVLYQNE